jgi:hypothetical protein
MAETELIHFLDPNWSFLRDPTTSIWHYSSAEACALRSTAPAQPQLPPPLQVSLHQFGQMLSEWGIFIFYGGCTSNCHAHGLQCNRAHSLVQFLDPFNDARLGGLFAELAREELTLNPLVNFRCGKKQCSRVLDASLAGLSDIRDIDRVMTNALSYYHFAPCHNHKLQTKPLAKLRCARCHNVTHVPFYIKH